MFSRASMVQADTAGQCGGSQLRPVCCPSPAFLTQCHIRANGYALRPHRKTRRRACKPSCATGSATSGAELQGRSYRGHLQYTTRMATTADFWAIAEVHAQSFYPTADWLFGPLLRLDRVCALQMGIDADVKGGRGRFACLLAHSLEAEEESSFVKPLLGHPGANVPPFFKFLLSENLQVGFSLSPERLGLLGAVVIDMQGQHMPAERIEKGPFVAYQRPEDVAYISNLAVSPAARRLGVGEELLTAAEKVAKDWGCKMICLHCDPFNEAACGLYNKYEYTKVRTQVNWLSFAGGPTRLQLMQKSIA
ncbi:acyl-CoA N-acyltransferase [Coccomyxa subellipsoidea C-169]|uniref:Acyl-CoA N-acyltransferase n=1 Tax=Coccomyxa subellipsoidea (strain C-169) TaxID=574566 RepID=I0Z6T8_COCSC|nr:acyl-CoA N-acyltransferase [Coccomyxa subellipsoidea C-169]EIE26357.1 acyl-CoA N-acyltransferase [Coccomyxa subellipsoidea C-169]|eukprot:XP_005650901.1 acyl-CoA N-acyltransferase [Coccomyxa subellipsoidea C-169]